MFRNYFLLNLILLIIIGLLGFKSYDVWTMHLPLLPAGTQQKPVSEKTPEPPKEEVMPGEGVFQAIVLKDIFRPSRTEPKPEEIAKPGITLPPPKLFGTIIIGDEKTAILEDPATKISKIYRINESVGGFVITNIQKDKVILTRDNEITEVYLREIKAFKPSTGTTPPAIPQPLRDRRPVPPQPVQPPPQPAQPPDVVPLPEDIAQ
ncbi:MAG: hypothetical protein HZC11_06865 [Nitrospirae bacterium]|nr:hypothetical protein [Nitrospirota bacterium]